MLSIVKVKQTVPSGLILIAASFAALSQNSAAAQTADAVTIDQFREELARRDAIIIDLLNRIEALEDRNAGGAAHEPIPQTDAFPSGAEAAAAPASDRDAQQGDFEVDELAAERALERSLVQQGVRLLASGQAEVTPLFSYSRSESDFPTVLSQGEDSFVGSVKTGFDVFTAQASARLGLPFNSQLEVGVPYRIVRQNTDTEIDGAVQMTGHRTGDGFGDIQLGLATVLAEEKAWRPNLIGRLTWITGSGDEVDNGVSLGSGNPAIAGRLLASWRRDPMVFLIGGGYTHYYDGAAIRPGNAIDVTLGTSIAVSPETALTFSLDQRFADNFENDGVEIPGTDRRFSTFNIASSTILGRGLFLRVNAGIGLTGDAADYQIGVSIPYRFGLR